MRETQHDAPAARFRKAQDFPLAFQRASEYGGIAVIRGRALSEPTIAAVAIHEGYGFMDVNGHVLSNRTVHQDPSTFGSQRIVSFHALRLRIFVKVGILAVRRNTASDPAMAWRTQSGLTKQVEIDGFGAELSTSAARSSTRAVEQTS